MSKKLVFTRSAKIKTAPALVHEEQLSNIQLCHAQPLYVKMADISSSSIIESLNICNCAPTRLSMNEENVIRTVNFETVRMTATPCPHMAII